MKAEHRKELETNVLADRMGRMLEAVKGAPSNARGRWGVLVVAAIVVAGIILAYYLINKSYGDRSALWVKLDSMTNADELAPFAQEHRGSIAARTARFDEARILLARGVENLGTQEQHASAVDSLDRARALYDALAPECKDAPLLQQEAMMGVAKAEESLVGSAKDGSLDKALELYQKLADAYADTFQGEAAKKRVKELQDPIARLQIQTFYTKLNERVAKGK